VNYLDINALRKTGARPAYFGLGFIQLKLNETERLHFWHESFPGVVDEDDLHDHRYNFESTVLAGSIWHETWTFLTSTLSNATHQMLEVSCSPDAAHEPKLLAHGWARRSNKYVLTAGSSYTINMDEFHRGGPNRRAVTLVRREPTIKELARVVRPVGYYHVCPFSNKLGTEDQLWDMMNRIILDIDLP
jgi:hypothetical protein